MEANGERGMGYWQSMSTDESPASAATTIDMLAAIGRADSMGNDRRQPRMNHLPIRDILHRAGRCGQ